MRILQLTKKLHFRCRDFDTILVDQFSHLSSGVCVAVILRNFNNDPSGRAV
jgi:hypothetical protein